MKKLATLVAAMLLTTASFASTSVKTTDALSAAWKNHSTTVQPQQTDREVAMVYGGQDVDHRPTIMHTLAA